MNALQLEKQLTEHILTNIELSKLGLVPSTIEIGGNHGIGKSDIAKNAVKKAFGDEGVFIYFSAAQLEDASDWVGLPSNDVVLQKEDDKITIPVHIAEPFIKLGYKYVDCLTSIKAADWTKRVVPNKTVILIDDYTRANPVIMQALMAFLLDQKLGDWVCPPGVTIILTTNPPTGSNNSKYQVSNLDDAQKDRTVDYTLDFDMTTWAKWARAKEVNGEKLFPEVLIDFAVQNDKHFKKISPRKYTMFMNSFVRDKELKNKEFLRYRAEAISMEFWTSLHSFIENNTDRVITPEEFRDKSDAQVTKIFNAYHTKKTPEKQATFMDSLMTLIKAEEDWKLKGDQAWIYQAQRVQRLKLISGDIAINFSKELCILKDGPELTRIYSK